MCFINVSIFKNWQPLPGQHISFFQKIKKSVHSIVQGIKDLAIYPIKNITQRSQGRRVEAGIARLSNKLIY
jgi:hypothetical protein